MSPAATAAPFQNAINGQMTPKTKKIEPAVE